MTSHESKIAALVALALGTDRAEEARTAAFLALQLAAKHGARIDVRAKVVSSAAPAPAPEPPRAAPEPTPAPAPQAPPRPSYARRERKIEWVVMPAKYRGKCKSCGATIRVGHEIGWHPTKGAKCGGCFHTSTDERAA